MPSVFDTVIGEADVPLGWRNTKKDEAYWRPLASLPQVKEDLANKFQSVLKHVRDQYITNPVARSMADTLVSYILGSGVTFEASDPRVLDWVQRWWTDPRSRWDKKVYDRVRDFILFGELYIPVAVQDDGFVLTSYISPADVRALKYLAENIEILDAVEVAGIPSAGVSPQSVAPRLLKVIRFNPETGRHEGDVFVFMYGRFGDSARGNSVFVPIVDWLNEYSKLMFSEVDRHNLMSTVVWDLELQGYTEDQIQRKLQQLQDEPPTARSIFAHNELVKLEPKTIDLSSADVAQAAQMFKTHILGTVSFPEFFYGASQMTGRTVAPELIEPAMRKLQMFQSHVRNMIDDMVTFVVERAVEAGSLPRSADPSVRVVLPRIIIRDLQRSSGAVYRLVQALTTAVEARLIDVTTAREVVRSLLSDLGLAPPRHPNPED